MYTHSYIPGSVPIHPGHKQCCLVKFSSSCLSRVHVSETDSKQNLQYVCIHTRARPRTHTYPPPSPTRYRSAWPASKPLTGKSWSRWRRRWRNRSRRGERRLFDGTATTLRSSRANIAAFRGYYALGTSMRRRGCAGRSYPSRSTSRSPPMWWERGAWCEQVTPIQPHAGIGLVLVWACCVRRTFWLQMAYSDGKRASGGSHATS